MKLIDRAKELVTELMDTASQIRENSSEELAMMFGFWLPEEGGMMMLPAEAVPVQTKDDLARFVQLVAVGRGATLVLCVCETRLSTKGHPSEDPDAKDAIMVTASGAGVNLCWLREINPDGSLSDLMEVDAQSGRMVNLSGREMMN